MILRDRFTKKNFLLIATLIIQIIIILIKIYIKSLKKN